MLNSEVKFKLYSMSDEELQDLLLIDFLTSPLIPIDQINDYLNSMSEEEKIREEIVFQAMEELANRRKNLLITQLQGL